MKLIAAAAVASSMMMVGGVAGATVKTFCESGGNPTMAGGMHPGRCSMGDIDIGNDANTTVNAGAFGIGDTLIFRGYGDNNDLDVWQFTANTAFTSFLDAFFYSGVGTNTGVISATLTDANGVVTVLNGAIGGSMSLGATLMAGTYSLQILGAAAVTDIYNYDLRVVSSEVPLPAGALLFGTGLAAAFGARRKKRVA